MVLASSAHKALDKRNESQGVAAATWLLLASITPQAGCVCEGGSSRCV